MPKRFLAVAMLLLAVACRDESSVAAKKGEVSDADVDRMKALGYDPWVAETPEPGRKTGLLLSKPDRMFPGYTLFASRGACQAFLLAPDGAVAHRWREPGGGFWSDTALLQDGTLLVVGGSSDDFDKQLAGRYMRALDWDSKVLWQSDFPAHHDVELTPDGNLLTLTSADRQVEGPKGAEWIADDRVAIATPQGHKLEEYSLYDLFMASSDMIKLRWPKERRGRDGRPVADIFHANGVQWISAGERAGTHPIFEDGNILVTVRHQDLIAVINPRLRRFVWVWPNQVQGPHQARLLPSGNILVFDNGLKRRTSRVVEMDPRSGKVVWKYPAAGGNRFFSIGGSNSERLPNGNTLIAVMAQGELLEVTHEGEIVWQFVNPIDRAQLRGTIHSATRLPLAFVEPILAKHGSS